MKQYLIASSILSADLARLGEETKKVLTAGADMIHFDIMDNHYVPNLTIGPIVLNALRNYGITAPIDVHLMIKPTDRIIPDLSIAGADIIAFHPEASEDIVHTIHLIKDHGCKVGLVLEPNTSLNWLKNIMDRLDMILLMSVHPGFSGQSFITNTLKKLREVRYLVDKSGYDIYIEIDGGIKASNISEIAIAGADTFVIGSAIFNQIDYRKAIREIRNELAKIS